MADERLRLLERAWKESNSDDDLATYVAARLRTDGDLVLRLIQRVIKLERNVPNTMNLDVTNEELIDFLDNDRALPVVHVPSVFIPGAMGEQGAGQITVSSVVDGPDLSADSTIATPDMDDYRVRELAREEIDMRVTLHAHFHCMKPDCTEQVAEIISSPGAVLYHLPAGWQRQTQMLLCQMHSYMANDICEREMGGHVHPENPPTNQTYSCTRCGYGPLYPAAAI